MHTTDHGPRPCLGHRPARGPGPGDHQQPGPRRGLPRPHRAPRRSGQRRRGLRRRRGSGHGRRVGPGSGRGGAGGAAPRPAHDHQGQPAQHAASPPPTAVGASGVPTSTTSQWPGSVPPARSSSARPTRRRSRRTSQTYNRTFGTTTNPWDATRTSGGSSGGRQLRWPPGSPPSSSATTSAARSASHRRVLRVYGHKSAYGLVPEPAHPLANPRHRAPMDMAVTGPIARSAGRPRAGPRRHRGTEARCGPRDQRRAASAEGPPDRGLPGRRVAERPWLPDRAGRARAPRGRDRRHPGDRCEGHHGSTRRRPQARLRHVPAAPLRRHQQRDPHEVRRPAARPVRPPRPRRDRSDHGIAHGGERPGPAGPARRQHEPPAMDPRRRGPPGAPAGVAAVLRGVRRPAVPRQPGGGTAPQPPLGLHDHLPDDRRRPVAAPLRRPDGVGRRDRHGPPAVDGGARGAEQRRPARRPADRRPLPGGPHAHRVRPVPGRRDGWLRAAPGFE